jgi:hypothetical protein
MSEALLIQSANAALAVAKYILPALTFAPTAVTSSYSTAAITEIPL